MEFSFFWNLEGLSCENETAIWQIWRKNKLGKFAAESFIITLLSVVKSYRVATFFPQNIVIAFLFWRLRWFPGYSSLSWFSLSGLAEDILRISWHRNKDPNECKSCLWPSSKWHSKYLTPCWRSPPWQFWPLNRTFNPVSGNNFAHAGHKRPTPHSMIYYRRKIIRPVAVLWGASWIISTIFRISSQFEKKLLFACQLSIARGNVSHLNLIVRLLSEVRARRAKGATRARGGTGVAI